ASPGLAGGRSTAGVGVVADAGHPGARCLRLGEGRKREHENRDRENLNCEPKLVHLESPFGLKFRGATSRTRMRSVHCCADSPHIKLSVTNYETPLKITTRLCECLEGARCTLLSPPRTSNNWAVKLRCSQGWYTQSCCERDWRS